MELPWRTTPIANPSRRWLRPAGYALLAIILILPVIQFQRGTMKYLNRAEEAREAHAGAPGPPLPPLSPGERGAVLEKDHKGAIGRWRADIQAFWRGENIYLGVAPTTIYVPPENPAPGEGWAVKHPNMPFVVMLLTPFTWLPVPLMALHFNLCKLAAAIAMIVMTARIVNHRNDRITDWVMLLGTLAAIDFTVGDIQHGNTNTFVAASVIAHLYFYRRGNDSLAGIFLALGICLKLTPALFLLYWLWQRQWKVLFACALALPAMMLVPALFSGWGFYWWCMTTWWNNLIGPALGGQWYPNFINQSLSGIVGRYFSGGDAGNYMWDPDTAPVPFRHGWITVVELGPAGAKAVLIALQAMIVGAFLWAIGWRILPRDDGRRALHYGMAASMMLLLNQRSWDHHATYLLIAHAAIAYAAAQSVLSRRARTVVAILQIASVLWIHFWSDDLMEQLWGEDGAARVTAYGTTFWHFLLVWILCLALTFALRKKAPPYHAPG
jgi:hypothetical protein